MVYQKRWYRFCISISITYSCVQECVMKMYEGVEVDIQAFLTCAVAGIGRLQDICLSVAL